eukprot:s1188_g12.t1
MASGIWPSGGLDPGVMAIRSLCGRSVAARPLLVARAAGLSSLVPPSERCDWGGSTPSSGHLRAGAGALTAALSTAVVRRRGRCRREVASFATATAVEAPAGEWAFRASVLGCEGALSGHVYLDPNGRAAYLADGVQIVGRGVGHWATNGEMVALELDVYQYAAAAALIPETPHRFRGVFELSGVARGPQQGDWFACPEGEAPRLVGGLDVAKDTMELLPLAMQSSASSGPAPRVDADQRNAAMAALDAQHDLRATPPGAPKWQELLAPYKVGNISEIYYIPNWISKDEEAEFFQIADGDMRAWEDMRTRSSQEWGAGDRCTCGRGLMRMPLPASQQKLADALHQLGIFDSALYPMNSVRINGYRPGQGIFPHCDGPVYYPKALPALFEFEDWWMSPRILGRKNRSMGVFLAWKQPTTIKHADFTPGIKPTDLA